MGRHRGEGCSNVHRNGFPKLGGPFLWATIKTIMLGSMSGSNIYENYQDGP